MYIEFAFTFLLRSADLQIKQKISHRKELILSFFPIQDHHILH